MNLMKMIIVMFLHFVSDLALLCRLSTNDLLEKVLGDPLDEDVRGVKLYNPYRCQVKRLASITWFCNCQSFQ